MKKRMLLIISILLVVVVYTIGCRPDKKESSDLDYSERKLELPEEFGFVFDIQSVEDEIKCITENKQTGEVEVWSKGREAKWSYENNFSELSVLDTDEILLSAVMAKNGKICGKKYNETYKEIHFFTLDEKQKMYELEALLQKEGESDSSELYYTSSGCLLGVDFPKGICMIDEKTGEITKRLIEDDVILSFDESEGKLSVLTFQGARTFDLDNKEEIGVNKNVQKFVETVAERRINLSMSILDFCHLEKLEDDGILGISDEGIDLFEDGEWKGTLVKSDQTVLGKNGQYIRKMFVYDGLIYVFLDGDEGAGLYYFESTDIEQKTLKVFCMEEDNSLKQAMILYRQEHPEVNFEVEMVQDDMESSDAIRQLNTKILSKDGPDILIADGLVIRDYLNQDVFMDLSEIVEKVHKEDGLLRNITDIYEQEGKICAVPTRFALMVSAGTEMVSADNEDMESLLLKFEEKKKMNEGDVVSAWSYGHMAAILYRADFQKKVEDTRVIDKQSVEEFYMDLMRLYQLCDMENAHDGKEASQKSFVDLRMNPMAYWEIEDINQGNQSATIDYISSVGLYSEYLRAEEEGVYWGLINQSVGKLFYPYSVIAVGKDSAYKETATDFVAFYLSQGAQKAERHYGIPVNIKAIQSHAARYNSMEGKENELLLNEGECEEFITEMKSLEIPVTGDIAVMEIVLTNAEKYIRGQMKLGDAVDATMEKVEIYQSE